MQKRRIITTLSGELLDITDLSARNRRIIALGIRGADGDEPEALDDFLNRFEPAKLGELTDEDLTKLRGALDARIEDLPADPKAWTDEHLEAGVKLEGAKNALEGVEQERELAAEKRAGDAAELLSKLRGDASADGDGEGGEGDGEGEGDGGSGDGAGEGEGDGAGEGAGEGEGEGSGEGDGGDGAGEGEGEGDPAPTAGTPEPAKVAASAKGPRRVTARGPGRTTPVPTAIEPDKLVIRASANVPGIPAGQELNPKQVAQAFMRTIQASRGYRGPRVDIPVVSLGSFDAADTYGAERTLDDNARENAKKIAAVTGAGDISAIRASGGRCVPSPIDYAQPVIGTDVRPVKGQMLATMGADRGGVKTLPPPHLEDVGGAITIWTEANDQDPSDPATKACLTLTCPDEEESVVDAIVQCLKIGNYRARNFPEQIQAWITKVAQQAARVAETKMLTEIGADSTQVAVPQVLGSTRDLLTTLGRATAQIRSRHRLDPSFPFHFGAPAWYLDHMIADLAREHPGATAERLATSDAEIQAFIAAREINASWFLDGETGQIYGAQGDGDLIGWASHVICYLYPEGQWLGLDGGGIDFGVTRDSILNATNDFIIMSEVFEATHQIHLADSYRLDIDICANGAAGGVVDLADVCVGHS